MKRSALRLDHVLRVGESALRQLDRQSIFVTGGTGFVGKWLIETFLAAKREQGINASMTILTRNAFRFRESFPHLADDACISFVEGDIITFPFLNGSHSLIIHAASDVYRPAGFSETFDVSVKGTERVLEFAKAAGTERMLLLSTGAVYGHRPSEVPVIGLDYRGAPRLDSHAAAYAAGKRAAEWLTLATCQSAGIAAKVARLFTPAGPYLPLDGRFAIGNFIGDVLAGRTVHIGGDGTPVRSYLHGAEMSVWLWTILTQAPADSIWDVGSDVPVSIEELARRVIEVSGSRVGIEIAGTAVPGQLAERYMPSIEKCRDELALVPTLSLDQCIEDMLDWNRG